MGQCIRSGCQDNSMDGSNYCSRHDPAAQSTRPVLRYSDMVGDSDSAMTEDAPSYQEELRVEIEPDEDENSA